jgi:hypothetical protein
MPACLPDNLSLDRQEISCCHHMSCSNQFIPC